MPQSLRNICKAWAALIGLLILLASVLAPAGAQTRPTLRILPERNRAEVNDEVQIRVLVEDAENLSAFQFDLVFDPAIVAASGATLGDFLGSTGRDASIIGPSIDNEAGRLTFAAFSLGAQPGPDGDGVLAEITLTGLANGATALELANIELRTATNAIVLIPFPGSATVNIGAPTATPTARPTRPATATWTATPDGSQATPTSPSQATPISPPQTTPTSPPPTADATAPATAVTVTATDTSVAPTTAAAATALATPAGATATPAEASTSAPAETGAPATATATGPAAIATAETLAAAAAGTSTASQAEGLQTVAATPQAEPATPQATELAQSAAETPTSDQVQQPEPTPEASASSEATGAPLWLLIVGGAALLLAGIIAVVLVVYLRRGRGA